MAAVDVIFKSHKAGSCVLIMWPSAGRCVYAHATHTHAATSLLHTATELGLENRKTMWFFCGYYDSYYLYYYGAASRITAGIMTLVNSIFY